MSDGDTRHTGLRCWIERLRLTNFRNHVQLSLDLGPAPVVVTGPNGSGKTNLLEAISLFAPGTGLRRAPLAELGRAGSDHRWGVAATVRRGDESLALGTGAPTGGVSGDAGSRNVRINGQSRGPTSLAAAVQIVWLTPGMDGLFMASASERRRFIDQLIVCFDAAHRTRLNLFERAMRQRNRLLEAPRASAAEFEGLELSLVESGVAIAAARRQALARLRATIDARAAREPDSPFPWADIAIDGTLENLLAEAPAIEVEDRYRAMLAEARPRDRAAGRLLVGPHRSDLLVGHGPKQLPARVCSTGEQKALLINLVLGHAELVGALGSGEVPILLLDEVTAHLDDRRRTALFAEVVRLGAQAWMTGTDSEPFAELAGLAQFLSSAGGVFQEAMPASETSAEPAPKTH
jgi:DNA replication and repair protein RecF